MGRIVKIIDKGKNINGSFMANSLTGLVTSGKCGINVVSTSVANPSVPGVCNVGNGTRNDSGKVCPVPATGKVRIVSMGLLLPSRRAPIV